MNASKTVLIMLLDFYLAILSTACMKTTYKSPAAPASVATATTTIPIPVVTATATSTTTTAVLIGHISTAVGVGHEGFSGDGGPATSANLFYPRGVAFDGSGNMYIADTNNYRIRKVATDGVISTYREVVGVLGPLYQGGCPATSAKIGYLYGVAVDNNGDVFFADIENNRIWKVDSTGNLSIAAGDGTPVPAADGVLATMSGFDHPYGVTFDPNGDLHILDTWNCMIRKVDAWGALTTVVGHLTNGYSGDGGAASSALISSIGGATFDSMGNLYIADGGNGRIRKVDTNGIITTVAGKGTMGYSGDGGRH
jgi:sugar lactone lactonase YvrE